jgi:hypothetical protein
LKTSKKCDDGTEGCSTTGVPKIFTLVAKYKADRGEGAAKLQNHCATSSTSDIIVVDRERDTATADTASSILNPINLGPLIHLQRHLREQKVLT